MSAGTSGRSGLSRRTVLGGALGAAALTITESLRPPNAEAANAPLYTRCSFGAHADDEPYPNPGAHYGLQSITGAKIPRMSWFQDMGAPWMNAQTADSARSNHALCIAWSPQAFGGAVPFGNIVRGDLDDLLSRYFEKAAQYPRPVTIRPFWEMNCSASSSSVDYQNGPTLVQSVPQFHDAWRHLVALQRRVGGSQVKWYFCVNGSDVGAHAMEEYWPGSDVVDEMGFDTYNDHWSPWADFDVKVAPMYERLAALDAQKPITIGEIACREDGAPPGESKASWSEKMFTSTQFPRLKHVDFFNKADGVDWRIQSSWSSLAVYQKYLPQATSGLVPW